MKMSTKKAPAATTTDVSNLNKKYSTVNDTAIQELLQWRDFLGGQILKEPYESTALPGMFWEYQALDFAAGVLNQGGVSNG